MFSVHIIKLWIFYTGIETRGGSVLGFLLNWAHPFTTPLLTNQLCDLRLVTVPFWASAFLIGKIGKWDWIPETKFVIASGNPSNQPPQMQATSSPPPTPSVFPPVLSITSNIVPQSGTFKSSDSFFASLSKGSPTFYQCFCFRSSPWSVLFPISTATDLKINININIYIQIFWQHKGSPDGHTQEGNEVIILKSYLHPPVHCSIVHKEWDMATS